jgi:hypothetical protein
MVKRAIASLLLILMLAGGSSVYAYPYSKTDSNVASALNWLRSQQQADGSIRSFAISSWAVMAIASSQEDPKNWRNGGSSVVEYLESNVGLLSSCSDYSRFLLSIVAAGIDPQTVTRDGVDIVTKLESFYDGTQFGDRSLINDDYWAVMALVSAGVYTSDPRIQSTLAFIKANQNATDHGWSWGAGQGSDADNTAAAIMALIAAGEPASSTFVTSGLSYMKAKQTNTGGFSSFESGASAETDSWAIQAIVAAGQDPTGSDWTQNGKTPVVDLLSFQDPGGGFKDPTGSPSAWTTSYAIPALLGKRYPIVSGSSVSIHIEGRSATVWKGEVFVSWSDITDDQGAHHYYGQPTVLGALDEASRKAGFTYVVNYGYGSAYVTTINGEAASGVTGWLFRVNDHTTGNYTSDGFVLNKATTPPPPHTTVLWYYGAWDDKVARISVNPTSVYSSQPFTVTVTYLDETSGTWLPVGAATVHADSTYLTDTNGQVSISIPAAGTYAIYAEKTGFVRTEQIPVTVTATTSTTSTSAVQSSSSSTTTQTESSISTTIETSEGTSSTTTQSSSTSTTTSTESSNTTTIGTTERTSSTSAVLPSTTQSPPPVPPRPPGCVIATAAYGSSVAPEVVYMRHVRDGLIGSTPTGRMLVDAFNTFYYSWSPSLARIIAANEALRAAFRVLLLPLVATVHVAALVFTTAGIITGRPDFASTVAFLFAACITLTTYVAFPVLTVAELIKAIRRKLLMKLTLN